MNLQSILFEIKEFFTGRKVKKHLNEVRNHYSSMPIGENDYNLNKLLQYVIESIPAYKEIPQSNLEYFPVINKQIIKSNLKLYKSPLFDDNQLFKMTTSGSTGTPFTVYQDLNKKARNHADTLFFAEMAGFRLGDRLLYLKIWAKEKMQRPILYRLQNIFPVDVLNLNDHKIEEVLDSLSDSIKVRYAVLGYVSALETVVRYCKRKGIRQLPGKFSSIITMSESLSQETKEELLSLFGCNVVSRYSNLENGIIAQQVSSEDHRFLINTASYRVEIMHPKKDEVLSEGNTGRIVITDLFNYAMPMVRYDTGDYGVMITGKDGKKYFKVIEGRKLDLLFDTKGNLISSYIMYKNMWKYEEIDQYQLIQTGKSDYTFKVNCSNSFSRADELRAEFLSYLGEDANFKIEYVEEIPLLNSGKRRKTMNLFRKTI